MPFPTVKSDPWKKGKRRRRRKFRLWSGKFWKKLCDQAQGDVILGLGREVSLECVRMISEMNRLLYGQEELT